MRPVVPLLMLLAATASPGAAQDTPRLLGRPVPPPAPARAPAAPVAGLPTGLGSGELQRFLAGLRPVPAAQPAGAGAPDGISRLEIDGLVVDETQTKTGRDFYQVFYAAWEAPPGARNYTIRVQEQPSPGVGTRIVVLINDEQLFQLQLQPRYEIIEELAQQAALYTRSEIERRQPAAMPAAAGDRPESRKP